MRRFWLALVVGALLLASLVMAVSAQQGDVLARVQPLLVSVQQQVPVSVTLSIPLNDGEAQTVTVPMALDLNLEISLSSTMSPVVSVVAAPASEPTVTVAEVRPTPVPDPDDPWGGVRRLTTTQGDIQARAGIEIEVVEVLLFPYDEAMERLPKEAEMTRGVTPFEGSTVYGLISVVVTNTADAKFSVSPEQGTAVVGSEQVEIMRFQLASDRVGGEIFPGVVKEGFVAFALRSTEWDDIAEGTRVIYEVERPVDADYFYAADEPYTFEFEVMPQ